jgi:outer membrane protein assembly factor BamB
MPKIGVGWQRRLARRTFLTAGLAALLAADGVRLGQTDHFTHEFDWPVDPQYGGSPTNRGLPISDGDPPTVIRSGEMVVVASGNAVGRYLFSGDRLWKRKFDGAVKYCAATDMAVLAAVEREAGTPTGSYLTRLAMASGEDSWSKDLGTTLITAEIATSQDQALVGDSNGRVRCLDLRDGRTAWASPYLWGQVQFVGVVNPDTIVLAISNARRLSAIDILTGQLLWQHVFLGQARVLRMYGSTALVHRVQGNGATAALFRVGLDSGDLLQAVNLKQIDGSPVITGDDQIIIRSTVNNRIQITKTNFTGKPLWSSTLRAHCLNDGALLGQTILHILSDSTAVAIDTQTGHALWQRRLPGSVAAARERPSGAQVCLLQDGTIVEINPADGEISWHTKILRAGAIETDGNLVCVSETRQLYVVRT